jgi:hypothetical protein
VLLEVTIENLELRVTLLVRNCALVDLVRTDQLLEGLHDKTSLYLVDRKSGKRIDTCSLLVSQSLRLSWCRWHKVALRDTREYQVVKGFLGSSTDVLSSNLISD